MSGNYRKTDGDIFYEKWIDFGKNLESYIESNKEELVKDSYDVILGFSRGGTILAYSFACLLKDTILEYSNIDKACVRPIPKGFTCKKNNPCFVMDHPTSLHEMTDIRQILMNDLKELSESRDNPLNVLIMDDNLTGATRVHFLEDELMKMSSSCVKSFKTLAYVHHNSFLPISTIREFPVGYKVFVMPWHIPHSKKELDVQSEEINGYKMSIFFKVDNLFNLGHFKDEMEKFYPIKKNLIVNGASNFCVKITKMHDGNFVELITTNNMFYPPKQCLKSEKSENSYEEFDLSEFLPICSLGVSKTMNVCLTCSHLNCNKSLFKEVLNIVKSQTISFEIKNNQNLKSAINDWFTSSMPEIKLMEFSND